MTITPYLLYENVEEAIAFLCEAFGFEEFGEKVCDAQGRVSHAAVKLEEDVVMMGWPGPSYRNPRRLGQATFSLYVTIDNVADHFEQAKGAGAQILEEPKPTFYGDLRYGAEDPEGHQWYFAQKLAGSGTAEGGD